MMGEGGCWMVLDMLVSLVNKRDCWGCGMLLLED